MGIKGLLKALSKNGTIEEGVNISRIGKRVAIDGSCWLHRYGKMFSKGIVLEDERCYQSLVRVIYAKTRNLFSQNIDELIIVFDGGRLPMKEETHSIRTLRRLEAKEEGMKALRSGRFADARNHFNNALQFSFDLVSYVVRKLNSAYDYSPEILEHKKFLAMIAPYEADAQLAYLDRLNLVDFIISEDSDLIVFGCRKVLYKLNFSTGYGDLYDYIKLFMNTFEKFSMTMLRRMCILSGCDYISNLPGIGLKTAYTIVLDTSGNLNEVFARVEASQDYRDKFVKAEFTFLHQYVFDISLHISVPLHPHPNSAIRLPKSTIGNCTTELPHISDVTLSNIDSAIQLSTSDVTLSNIDFAIQLSTSDVTLSNFSNIDSAIQLSTSDVTLSNFSNIDFAGKSMMTLLVRRVMYAEIHPENFTIAKDIPGVKVSTSFSIGEVTTKRVRGEHRPSVLSKRWLTNSKFHTSFHILKKQRLITEFFQPIKN
jgi:exonuclease-1